MGNLADYIERYLKSLIEQAQERAVELQRCELARRFSCVPSQINYVLATRFTIERGYLVETRRGGGGYIRIIKVEFPPMGQLFADILGGIGSEVTSREVDGLFARLEDAGLVSEEEEVFLKAILRRETAGADPRIRGIVRAKLLKAMLAILLHRAGI